MPLYATTYATSRHQMRAAIGFLRVLVLVGAAFIGLQAMVAAQTKTETRRVLILNDLNPLSSPGFSLMDQAMLSGLEKSPYQIDLYSETLETTLFSDEASQHGFHEWYVRKYRQRKPDVIIAMGYGSLKFMVESHERFFAGIPIVFCGTTEEMVDELKPDSHFTGVWGVAAPKKTLDSALRLSPGTKHLVVVGGIGAFDRHLEAIAKESLRSYESRLDVTYLTDLDMPTLLRRVGHLPDHTIVYHTSIMQDVTGRDFIDAKQSAPMVAAAANAPVFIVDDVDLGKGTVGGDLVSWAHDGEIAAEMVVRVLKGEKTQDIPVVKNDDVYMFDWRALRRWGLNESDLPPGSILLNRQPTIWEAYKWYIVGGLCLLFAQTALIVGLAWQRARRRKAEAEFIQSEAKFSTSFRHSPLAITITNANDCRYIEVNEAFERHTGWKRDEVIGRTPFEIGLCVDPDQRHVFLKQLLANGSVKDLEVRFRTKDGETRTGLGSAEVIEVNGVQCALSVIADITERKAAEEALSTVSRRLIEAQDAERTRIARELHDDINQRLALLRVNLTSLKEELPGAGAQTSQQIEDACAEMADLGNDIQALSHRLHSSRLEYLGLDAASAGLCREISERQKIEIRVDCQGFPKDLSSDISFCLFRVLQEALQNAVKHSGATKVEVAFTSSLHEIRLMVRDSGAGFDPAITPIGHGLGLISMRERLKLVDGQLSIDSKPQFGTTILVYGPLRSSTDPSRAVA